MTIRTEFKPEKGRYLRIRPSTAPSRTEAARIQGFSDDYKWVGSRSRSRVGSEMRIRSRSLRRSGRVAAAFDAQQARGSRLASAQHAQPTSVGSPATDLAVEVRPATQSSTSGRTRPASPATRSPELVANAYDADATEISVRVIGSGESQRIVVEDTGMGMSRDHVSGKYLLIGKESARSIPRCLKAASARFPGRKGLGKLALFGHWP